MEYNPETGKTTKYTYGSNSNIQHVMICTGKTNNCEYEMSYSYDSNYKDRVVEIEIHDNVNITHTFKEFTYGNTYGSNPDHFAGMDMIWNGRRLIEVTDNNKTVEYTYNEAGIRTSRTVNGVTTQYHLLGDNIISLTKGNDKLFFHYNERGMAVGFEYNKENYFYHRDLTGVITSVIDKNGDVMIKYIYDAWGNWLNKESAALTSIGSILLSLNPFIYKGYVYDSETDLYYLKSRYYSPSIRRFINADSEIGDVGDLENYNLFAYCMNNPVMYYDPNGNFVITATIALLAIGILAIIATIEAIYHPISKAIKTVSNYIASIDWEERWNNFTEWVSSRFTGESETSSTALPSTVTTSWENGIDILSTSSGRQSESWLLGKDKEQVEAELKEAQHAGDNELVQKILRHLKWMKSRNITKRKEGKGPKRRGIIIFLLLEEFFRWMNKQI